MDRDDLFFKISRLNGLMGPALGFHGEGVLLLPGNVEALRHIFRSLRHTQTGTIDLRGSGGGAGLNVGIHQGVFVPAPAAAPQIDGGAAHVFRPSSHNGFGLASPDLLVAAEHSLHGGGAQAIDGIAGNRLRKAGLQQGAPGDVRGFGALPHLP